MAHLQRALPLFVLMACVVWADALCAFNSAPTAQNFVASSDSCQGALLSTGEFDDKCSRGRCFSDAFCRAQCTGSDSNFGSGVLCSNAFWCQNPNEPAAEAVTNLRVGGILKGAGTVSAACSFTVSAAVVVVAACAAAHVAAA